MYSYFDVYHIINNTEKKTISCAHVCKSVFTDINATKVSSVSTFFRKVVYEVDNYYWLITQLDYLSERRQTF